MHKGSILASGVAFGLALTTVMPLASAYAATNAGLPKSGAGIRTQTGTTTAWPRMADSSALQPLATLSVQPVGVAQPTVPATDSSGYDWNFSFVPLPILATLNAEAELRHTPGPLDQYAIAAVAWNWFGRDVYDPTTTTATVSATDPLMGKFTLPRPVASYTTPDGGLAPFFDARLGWGLNFLHVLRLKMIGHYMASNLEPSGATWIAQALGLPGGLDNYYDPNALIDGPILTVGPHFDLLDADDLDFPTSGWIGRLAADFGPHWLFNKTKQGAPNDFALYRGELAHFFPIGSNHDKTLLLNVLAGYGTGDIPMYFRFSSGGTIYQRGYLWDRFGGDQMLVGTIEFRHLAWPNLIPAAGIGLMYDAYADYGRVWESPSEFDTCQGCGAGPVPFPQDMRLGVGAGLGLEIGRSTLGRLDLMWGNEGVPYQPLFGATTWEKIIPGVGLSLNETW